MRKVVIVASMASVIILVVASRSYRTGWPHTIIIGTAFFFFLVAVSKLIVVGLASDDVSMHYLKPAARHPEHVRIIRRRSGSNLKKSA